MAKDDAEQDQITIAVPLRRLLTGVPRPARAPSAIPRVKRFVLRHIDPDWRDAIWDEDRGVHRVWIDDFLNKAIWSRGREHVGGPTEWMEAAAGQRPRLARRTSARYGSVLKVKALFVEEPRDGGDARLEVYLYGYDDLSKAKDEEGDEDERDEKEEDEAEEAPEDEEGDKDEEKEAEPSKAKPAPKSEAKPAAKKPASTSAAAKSVKPAAKPETKKPAAKPKKEGGD
jgi:ribosomal protein L31E